MDRAARFLELVLDAHLGILPSLIRTAFAKRAVPSLQPRGINGLQISYSFREDGIFHRKLRPGPCNARHGDGFVSAAAGGFAGAAGFAAPAAVGVAGVAGWAVRGEMRPAATIATRPTSIPNPGAPTNSSRSSP